MKRLLFAIAGAAAFSAFATDVEAPLKRSGDISFVGFENYAADQTVIGYGDDGQAGNSLWAFPAGADDASLVKAYSGSDVGTPACSIPAPFSDAGGNYLALDTNGSELTRNFKLEEGQPAAQSIDSALYIDTLVQFTPSESAPTTNDLNGAKLAIWLGVENNVTNLCVAGDYYWNQSGTPTGGSNKVYRLSGTYEPSTWYRLTVEARDISNAPESVHLPGFIIRIDGEVLAASEGVYESTLSSTFASFTAAADKTLLDANKFIPAMNADFSQAATLTSVGFKGTGALDDFVVTTAEPAFEPAAIDFTLTWPAGLTAVSYSIDGGAAVAISGASPLSIPNLVGGEAITFIVQNADGAQKTLSATAANGEGIDATSTTFGWAEYLGAAVDGAYEIDDVAELILFQKGVAAGLATASTTFKLTDDVTLTAPWQGVGLKNAKDTLAGDSKANPPIAADMAAFVAGAFNGIFDGQNHTISGFQMVGVADNPKNNEEGLDYCGFFNAVAGATIRNLKIQYAAGLFAVDTTSSTKESGATFVGVTTNSTLQNLTALQKDAATAVSCSKGFGGIVGYLTAGTTVEYCTNYVNMTSLAKNKCGGIAMITQGGSGQAIIRNCQNNGTQTTGSSNSEYGAIVGYVGVNTTIADCETTVGRFLKHQGSTVTLQGVNKGDATVAAYHGAATPGLNFATVDGSVATFVADSALAAGNIYKVLGPSATATYEFAAAGSISFDTNLIQAVTFAITAAQGLDAPTETTADGVVTFTVAAPATPLNPGQDDGETYATEEAAAEAAASVTIAAATEVATALGETEAANYVTNFEAKAVSNGAGGYTVQVVLKESVEEVLQDQANADAGTVVDALDAATATVTTTPGFYYSVKYGASLEAMNYRTAGELATGTSKALTMPAKPGTSGFYKVVIDIAPSAAVAPAQE